MLSSSPPPSLSLQQHNVLEESKPLGRAPSATASVSGTIFEDYIRAPERRRRGARWAGVPDVIVSLFCGNSCEDARIADVTFTDEDGAYSFDGVAPGQSCFVEVVTDGYLVSPKVKGGSQLDRGGRSKCAALSPGDAIGDWDGFIIYISIWDGGLIPTTTIDSSIIFTDSPDEPILPGIGISLWCGDTCASASPTRIASISSMDNIGAYSFEGIRPDQKCFVHVDAKDLDVSPMEQDGTAVLDQYGNTPCVSINPASFIIGRQLGRLWALKSIAAFNEGITSLIEDFASSLKSLLEGSNNAALVKMGKDDGANVLAKWKDPHNPVDLSTLRRLRGAT